MPLKNNFLLKYNLSDMFCSCGKENHAQADNFFYYNHTF